MQKLFCTMTKELDEQSKTDRVSFRTCARLSHTRLQRVRPEHERLSHARPDCERSDHLRPQHVRSPMNKIEMLDLAKSYDGHVNVLAGLNLTIAEGEFFILVGPSGCGKSTLLRIIAGLEEVTGGEIRIDSRRANDMLPKERNLTMVFQGYALYPHLSVRDNILFGLDVKKVPKSERERRLSQAAQMLGLTELLSRKPRELSGGQRQRVALARSVCSHAPLWLMDEPLSNLDARLRAQMRGEIRRLQRALGVTVVYVTHDQVEAMTMGDRIAVLSDGAIRQVGKPLDLYNRPADTFVAGFIGTPQMCMAPARLDEHALLIDDALRIPLPSGTSSLPGGDHWTVGIRPESIHRWEGQAAYACQVKATSVEAMGNETLVSFVAGKEVFTARWQGQPVIQDSTLKVILDPDDMCFFETNTGRLLRPALSTQTSRADETPTGAGE